MKEARCPLNSEESVVVIVLDRSTNSFFLVDSACSKYISFDFILSVLGCFSFKYEKPMD